MLSPHTSTPPFALGVLTPPYDTLHCGADSSGGPSGTHPGSVRVLRVICPTAACTLLPSLLPALRAQVPEVPVVLNIAAASPEAIHLTGRATRLHARAVITEGEPWEPTLRRVLTRPVDLAGDVMEWLALRGVEIPVRARALVEAIVRGVLQGEELGRVPQAHDEAETTARAIFRAAGLPPPSEWYRVARALRAVLAVQAIPRRSLLEVAHDLGYADHSALSQQFRRCFDLRPGEVRETVGWEWVLDRWVRRVVEGRERAVWQKRPEPAVMHIDIGGGVGER